MNATRAAGRMRMALAVVRTLWLTAFLLGMTGLASAASPRYHVLEVPGPITPTIVSYLERGIDQAERDGATGVIVQLDTPGGLDDSTRKIMQRIIASRVPVIVFVYPSGGRAASAGLFITQAAHVAAMAPDTNLGSAHPVQLGGGGGQSKEPDKVLSEKIENDAVAILTSITRTRGRNAEWVERAVRQSVNVSAREALELRVVDLVAADYPSLLAALDGREIQIQSGRVKLVTADAELRRQPMGLAEQIIQTISDPNIAYLLLTIGTAGLFYELANPGTWVPGVIGGIALLLALYALGTLPTNWAGVGLIVFAFGLFLGDIFLASSHGGLTAAGIVAFLLGSLFLFSGASPELQLSPWVVATTVLTIGGFFGLVVGAIYRSLRRRPVTGREGLVGQLALVSRDLAPAGQVKVAGELWRAELADAERPPVARGGQVRVVAVDGLTLKVQ